MHLLRWLVLLAGTVACGDIVKGDSPVDAAADAATCADLACPTECVMDPSPRCAVLTPSFTLTRDDMAPTPGLEDVTMSATTVINVDDGSITNLRGIGEGVIDGIEFIVRDGVGIFRFKTLAITGSSPAQSLTFFGRNAVALVATTSIVADGTIFNLQGTCSGNAAGPGGVPGAASGGADGMGGASNGSDAESKLGGRGGLAEITDGDFAGGGGGGGHLGSGGRGGRGGIPYEGGEGGSVDDPIRFTGGGGGGGGGGLEFTSTGSYGGGGGGALHLAANKLVRITNGGVHAGGCGGGGSLDAAGSGGGAGGMLVIEADDIELQASTFAANGGGGGGGLRGANGTFGVTAAAGGAGMNQTASGGAGSISAAAGIVGTGGNTAGGGGGGGAGRIHLNSGDGLFAMGSTEFSPAEPVTGTRPVE